MSKRGTMIAALFLVIGILWLAAVPSVISENAELFDSVFSEAETAETEELHFAPITVEDDGRETWKKKWGEEAQQQFGVSIYDSLLQEQYLRQEDGSILRETVHTMHLNNVWFSVAGEGTRAFGYPVFTTELFADGEWEAKEEWHDRDVTSRCYEAAFNEGMEQTRQLIKEGYLQEFLEVYLKQYPEIEPEQRMWTLSFIDGGHTDREMDDVSWWELSYRLSTTVENGEIVTVGWLDIHKTVKAGDFAFLDDADYSMYPDGRGIWRLLEEAATDKGVVWIDQMPGEDFSDEQAVREFVERQGAGFLLPPGADEDVKWVCQPAENYWYDYLVWHGYTADYELTLAIPIMPEDSGGWYMASRIRKEALEKEECAHVLSAMMQTLRTEPYTYTIKEGDTLTKISRKYMPGNLPDSVRAMEQLNEISDPDLIYPHQQIILPERSTGKDWKAPQ